MNFIKRNIKLFVGILIGMLISGGVVFAAALIDSSNVTYSPSDDNWNVSDVKSALDDIYSTLFPECTYNPGEVWTFEYTGEVRTWEVPCNGVYRLEVWGGEGGKITAAGGKGGYASGTVKLSNSNVLNVVVAGGPTSGFNGGGVSTAGGTRYGGGATHIALRNIEHSYTTLPTYVNAETAINYVYIVAGGGGVGGSGSSGLVGGSGGGTTGGNGTRISDSGSQSAGSGATQTTGAVFGEGCSSSSYTAPGGGGWYGGYCNTGYNGYAYQPSSGGGSAYLNETLGLANGQTIAGNASMPTHDGTSTMTGNSGNGYAKITLVSIN